MTTDTGEVLHFWAHRRLVREALVDGKILTGTQFDVVAWEVVYDALHSVPCMFQLWACKQVLDIAGASYPRCKWDKTVNKWCPCCQRAKETVEHVPLCREAGRVETLSATIVFWISHLQSLAQTRGCSVALSTMLGDMDIKLRRRFVDQSMSNTRSWRLSKTSLAGGGLWRGCCRKA
jgi:hypothetical protein